MIIRSITDVLIALIRKMYMLHTTTIKVMYIAVVMNVQQKSMSNWILIMKNNMLREDKSGF